MSSISDLITRKYSNFVGVDFTGGNVSYYHSPDAKNMWINPKDDDCIQTRPGMTLLSEFDNEVFGLFFFTVGDYTHVLVHCGTRMLEWENYPTTPAVTKELYTGLKPSQGQYFVYDNVFFYKEGTKYLEYDGIEMKDVVGTIPITSYWKNPDGSTTIDSDEDTDLVYQPVNVLTNLRKNLFLGDGTSTEFVLDTQNLDPASSYLMVATVNNEIKTENVDFSVDREKGIVKFNEAPPKEAEVVITLSKTAGGYKERILNCTLLCEFDNRIFFSGNKDYPNAVFHSELNAPRYIRDTAYYECGLDIANVKAIVPGNNVLWIIKEISQNSSSLYYLTPSIDSTYGKVYPSVSGSISLGCVSKAINFNDDVVFFSNRGLEGVANSALYSEQVLQHRSSMVDTKMLSESGYNNVKLAEYRGYLLCLIDSKIYLANSNKKFQNQSGDIEYNWFYWELPNEITYIKEYRGELYLGNANGQLFKLDGVTDNGEDIESYWCTYKDDFGYPSYTKTTNKRGNVAYVKKMGNTDIHIDTIVDDVLKEKKVFSDEKGYIPYRIKDKKFTKIQIKFSSNKPFGLFNCTLQGFVAGYIKR